jgi:DNA-binding beta-propeller fold protein YncE
MKSSLTALAACSMFCAAAFGQPDPHVSVYRCADDSLVARLGFVVPTFARPVLWNPQDNRLYVSTYDGLYVVDCSTDVIVDAEQIALESGTPALAAADQRLYCPSVEDVVVYDCLSGAIVKRIALPDYAGHVVWSADQNSVYVSFDLQRSCIAVIDCQTDSIVKYIPVVGGAAAMCLRASGDKLYFGGDHRVGVVDLALDSVVRVIHLPGHVTWLAMNPATDRLVVQNWWNGTFVIDCAGDTIVDSLPYNVARFGGLDVRTNRLYLFLSYDALCTIDMETGLVLDTLMTGHVSSMALDTSDNKAYVLMDEDPYQNDTVWVVDADSGGVLRIMQTQEYATCAAIWNPLMNKVYIGGVSPPPGLEEMRSAKRRTTNVGSTVLSGASGVKRLASCVVFDAMGRRVAHPRSGVFFVCPEPSAESRRQSAVTKVVITR